MQNRHISPHLIVSYNAYWWNTRLGNIVNDFAQPMSDITRPKLMPRKAWTRPPTEEEAEVIAKFEARYVKARATFERYDAGAKDSYNLNPAPIAPDRYLHWLRTATRRYNERNAEHDPALRKEMKVMRATLAGLGHIDGPPRHGEVALTVAAHRDRVRGERRGFVTDGDRVHLHHVPKFESLLDEIEYERATSVGIGDRLHAHLHKRRDPQRVVETRRAQVDGDMDFITPHMMARGYTQLEIQRAREKAHDLNSDLGVYRGNR